MACVAALSGPWLPGAVAMLRQPPSSAVSGRRSHVPLWSLWYASRRSRERIDSLGIAT